MKRKVHTSSLLNKIKSRYISILSENPSQQHNKPIYNILISINSYYIEYKLNLKSFLIYSINFVLNEITFASLLFIFTKLLLTKMIL